VLRAFYRQHYHSGNCKVYVSGKVTPEIVACIEGHLGDAPWGEVKPVQPLQLIEPSTTTQKHVFVEKADALQSSLKMGCFVVDRLHPDFLKARAMVTLFGGYFGSRLMSNIREDKGYTYGIGAGVVNCPGSGIMAITTEADNQYIDAIIREVYHEWTACATTWLPVKKSRWCAATCWATSAVRTKGRSRSPKPGFM
jgi:predicted Zn-dependent peptidase